MSGAVGSSREFSDASNDYESDAFESASESEDYQDDAFEEDEDSCLRSESQEEHRDDQSTKPENDQAKSFECDLFTAHNDPIPKANEGANWEDPPDPHNNRDNGSGTTQAQVSQTKALVTPVHIEYWCREKAQLLGTQRHSRMATPNKPRAQTKSAPMFPPHVIASLSSRLKDGKTANDRINFNSKPESIPNAIMNRVRVSRLASEFSSDECKQTSILWPSRSKKTLEASISTFCSVKSAELQGRLVTQQLHDRCSKWKTSNNSDGASLAVVTSMTESIANQRKALQEDESMIPSFQTSFRREALVEATTKQLQASVALREQALALLNYP